MRRTTALFFCLPAIALLTSAASIAAQPPAATPSKASTAEIKLEPVKQLRKGVDAWPLLANPASPAELKVNATLTRLNLRLTKALAECDASVREDMKGKSAKDKAGAIAEDWSRKIRITMTGPRFLSLVANDETFCGGAHPDEGTMVMVFDMTTGAPVNWPALLPATAGASSFEDTASDGSKLGALVLPALAKINLAHASADCKDAFQDPQSFLIWPDVEHETLVAMAFDLPHVAAACATEIPLTMKQARKLGFDESVLTAIEQAHR